MCNAFPSGCGHRDQRASALLSLRSSPLGGWKASHRAPDFPASKANMSLYLSFLSPITEEAKRRGVSICCVPQHPNPLGCLSLQPGKNRDFITWCACMAGMAVAAKICAQMPRSGAGPLHLWVCQWSDCVDDAGISDYSSGLDSTQLHLKGALKLEVMAHVFTGLTWLSTHNEANLYECMSDTGPGHCLR